MKLVIDISKSDYEYIKKLSKTGVGECLIDNVYEGIRKGIVLPKGHGKIGDIDAIILEFSKSKAMTITEKMKALNILWHAWKNMCLVEADMEDGE